MRQEEKEEEEEGQVGLVQTQDLDAAATAFEREVDALASRIVERMHEELHEMRTLEAPEMWAAIRRMTREGRLACADHLRRGCELPESCPEPDRQSAAASANFDISHSNLMRAFRIAHAESWDLWLEAIDGLGLPAGEGAQLMRTISRFAISYDDRLMDLVSEEHERERLAHADGNDRRRSRQVRALLDSAGDGDSDLEYPLHLEHLGVIAWGDAAVAGVTRLAAVLDRRLLWAPAPDELTFAWLGGRAPLDPRMAEALAVFIPPEGCRLAIGSPAYGVDGFRTTHREAGEAHVLAQKTDAPVTIYRDVMLEVLALRDTEKAREFVWTNLRDLGGGDERSRQLRQTMRAYFAASQNAASTAAALGVHEQTISRRLKTIEELIGTPVNSRRAELELALRLLPLVDQRM